MRVLGDTPETPQVDSWVIDVLPGDRFLLCSDGLCGYVSDELIERNMRSLAEGSTIAEDLLGEALEAGAPDNVTIVTVDVLTSETPTDYEAQPTYVGSAANDVVISDRKGRRGLALLNPRKIGDLFRGSEETTDFVPESDEFLEKVLADTRKRIFKRKIRQVLTIVAISAVELLKAFLVSTTLTGEQIGWKIAIHLTFVISGLLFAASDWISDNRKSH